MHRHRTEGNAVERSLNRNTLKIKRHEVRPGSNLA